MFLELFEIRNVVHAVSICGNHYFMHSGMKTYIMNFHDTVDFDSIRPLGSVVLFVKRKLY